MFNPQTYPHSEEFGTVIEDVDYFNVNSEKELSLEQKLELAITKKISKPKYHTEIRYIQNHPTRDLQAFLKIIETEKKIHMVSTYLYSCSDSSNAQPPHFRSGNEILSPKSDINRV
ncbi:hypothetical protein TNCV_784351 [Trichonephila clavipes]|nr:hypothetical protein TNCV_784351 [Trichonephila clavipes]